MDVLSIVLPEPGWRMLTSVTRDGLLTWVLYFCHNSSTLPVLPLHMEVMYMLIFPIPRLSLIMTKSVLGEPGNKATLEMQSTNAFMALSIGKLSNSSH